MSWGSWGQWANTALQVAGTVYAANAANKGAESAANAAGQASADTNALNKYIYDDQRNLAMPGYQRGEWAANTLASYLGMPTSAMTAAPQAGAPSGLTAEEWYLRQNPDVKNHPGYGRDPRAHYEKYGRAEGRAWGVPEQAAPAAQPAATQSRSALYEMFRQQPGYQFGLDEGRKTVEAGAAARGGLNSGATLKALTKYGQDYADAKGWQPYLNQLQSMAGLSQTASAQIGNAGQNYASAVGQSNWNAANARGQSAYQRGQNNAWLAGQIGSIGSDLYGAYQQRNGGY